MDFLARVLTGIPWEQAILVALRILLILVAVGGLIAALKAALRNLEQRLLFKSRAEGQPPAETEKRVHTLIKLLRQGALIVVWVVSTLVILRELQVEIAPILASAGIVGLAIGFGAQNLVRDVISGFFMLLENQVRVGDVAVINGTGGLVEQVNFRTIVLRDLSGSVHVFPNGTITTLSNLTYEWSAYVFDIRVDYNGDLDKVIEVMRQVGNEMRADPRFGPSIIDDVEVFGVDDFAESAVIIKGRIKTKPIRQWEVGREYRLRLKKAFDAQGIQIPFPHRTVHFKQDAGPLYPSPAKKG